MSYQIWVDDFDTILKYYLKTQNNNYSSCKKCTPFSFKVNDKIKNTFDIKEIDSLTCNYKDENEFIAALKKTNQAYLLYYYNGSLTLTHTYKTRLFHDELIYGNKLLQYYAINNRNKKKLKMTENLNEFIQYIKSFALNPIISPYLLNPSKAFGLEVGEKELLCSVIYGKNISNNKFSNLNDLINLLKRYKNLIEIKNIMYEDNLDEEIRYIEGKITNYFTDSYQNLRKVILWEKTYQEILERKVNEPIDEVEKIMFNSHLQLIYNQKKYKNENDFALSYEDAKSQYLSILKNYYKNREISNLKMRELYEMGGLDYIRMYMDIDEIFSNGVDDAISVGLVPVDYIYKKEKTHKK